MSQSRANLGPLTSAWTAPDACTIRYVDHCLQSSGTVCSVSQGQRCAVSMATVCDDAEGNPVTVTTIAGSSCRLQGMYSGVDDPGCWPPTATTTPTTTPTTTITYSTWQPQVTLPTTPLQGRGFYSPGIMCPGGQTMACIATHGGRIDGWQPQFPLEPEETAAGCCPSGFTCDRRNEVETCVSYMTKSTYFGLNCNDSKSQYSTYIVPFSDVFMDTGGPVTRLTATHVVYAPLIQINWRSTDRGLVVSTGTPYSSGSGSRSLSAGAKAGIGVGVSAFGLIAFGFVLWFFLGYRRRRLQEKDAEMPDIYELSGKSSNPAELPEAKMLPQEMDTDMSAVSEAPTELPRVIYEME